MIFFRNTHFINVLFPLLQRRKPNNKPRDSSTAAGDTAAESVRNLIKKNPKYSKRINYDALKDLFVDSGGLPSTKGDDDKDEANLYTIGMDDDKSDGEATLGVIVEEESGTVALKPTSEPEKPRKNGLALDDMDAEGEIDEGSDDEKDDDIGWEDAYEQEV